MQQTAIKRIIVLLLMAAILAVAWLASTHSPKNVLVSSPTLMMLGTLAHIHVECPDEAAGRAAIERAKAAIKHVDDLMSTYRDDTELARVNRLAAEEPQTVSAETFMILQKSLYYSELTDGAFDITVAPLIAVWKTAAAENHWPDEAALAAVRANVGYQHVRLHPLPDGAGQVSFDQPGIQLNVNAIAKGYAVDAALAALKGDTITAGLVDIGGEVACFGKTWKIGIQDPFAEDINDQLSTAPRWTIYVKDGAVATSGNYRRYITVDNRKLSHIIDPRTAQPADRLPGVTIIAPTCLDADALATAVSVLGPDAGLALIESLPKTDAFLILDQTASPQAVTSKGFNKYLH